MPDEKMKRVTLKLSGKTLIDCLKTTLEDLDRTDDDVCITFTDDNHESHYILQEDTQVDIVIQRKDFQLFKRVEERVE